MKGVKGLKSVKGVKGMKGVKGLKSVKGVKGLVLRSLGEAGGSFFQRLIAFITVIKTLTERDENCIGA